MTFTAASLDEAIKLKRTLNALYSRDGWIVEIVPPQFDGDTYYVNVV
jgi:hypothetical protein